MLERRGTHSEELDLSNTSKASIGCAMMICRVHWAMINLSLTLVLNYGHGSIRGKWMN